MRIALDTNLLVYAEGLNGADRRAEALAALQAVPDDEVLIPTQALAELFAVLVRKGGFAAGDARAAVLQWADAYGAVGTEPAVLIDAMELVVSHRIALWDAVILASAAAAGCRLLLSEDMQDGFTWRGVTVRNPLRPAP